MDGDEVLRRMKADAELQSVPVIVVSSEKHRERDCLRAGAEAFLAKPIRSDELAALVENVLSRRREQAREGSLRVLFVAVGGYSFGLPLEAVAGAVQLPLTQSLPAGPSYLSEYAEIYGEPMCVLDVAQRLGVEPGVPRLEQKLVVIQHDDQKLALKVDKVADPEELPRESVVPRTHLGGAGDGPLRELLIAMVHGPRGALPVLDPRALLQRSLWRSLPELLSVEPRAS
jgi:chemotaxis signal transduction protein